MIHIEIPWSYLYEMINVRLRAGGIDPNKEMKTWAKFENDAVTLVYEQEPNAQLTEQGKVEEQLNARPAYLNNLKRGWQ